jgi:hypothetical protein
MGMGTGMYGRHSHWLEQYGGALHNSSGHIRRINNRQDSSRITILQSECRFSIMK